MGAVSLLDRYETPMKSVVKIGRGIVLEYCSILERENFITYIGLILDVPLNGSVQQGLCMQNRELFGYVRQQGDSLLL